MKNKCKQCGQCCKDVMLPSSPKDLKEDYQRWRNNGNRWTKEIYLIYPMLSYKFYNKKTGRYHYECKHLKFKGKKAFCSIQGTKPEMCSGFPYYNNKELRMTLEQKSHSQYKGCGFNE